MPFSMSQASLPTFEIGLAALSVALDKAQAFAAAKNVDPAVLLNTRLAPDMFPLVRQVQVATDQAKNGAARLAGLSGRGGGEDRNTERGHCVTLPGSTCPASSDPCQRCQG